MSGLAVETRDFALELYELLRSLDRVPGEEAIQTVRRKVERLRDWCRRLMDSEAARDEAMAAVVRALRSLMLAFEELAARLSEGLSTASAFAAFRTAAAPHYETLAARLRAMRVDTPTLRPSNWKRSVFHVASGLVGVVSIALLPWPVVIGIAATFFTTAWTLDIGRRYVPALQRLSVWIFRSMMHPHEYHRVNSATWYATALFIMALTSSALPCLLAVLVLAVGDPAAGLVGRRWGRTRLIAGRSLEGSLAFVAVSSVCVLAALALVYPHLAMGTRVALALGCGVVGSIVELTSRRVDDNLSIPLAVTATAHVVLALVG